MPRGTGYRLEDFSVGDEVIIQYVLDGSGMDYANNYSRGFNPKGVVALVVRVRSSRISSYPIKLEFYHPFSGEKVTDSFRPHELEPVTMNREPDWEI